MGLDWPNLLSLHIPATETLGPHTETCLWTESQFAFMDMPSAYRTETKPVLSLSFYLCHCIYFQIFWLHSLPLASFTAKKTHGTKHFLTQPSMESKSSFSALVRMTANQMHKASFHKFYFPTSWPSLACP